MKSSSLEERKPNKCGSAEARKFGSLPFCCSSASLHYCLSRFRSVLSVALLLYCSAALLLCIGFQSLAYGAEKWPGVDESIVEKFAKEHGRGAKEPLINTDQGDLLLFVFLLAGTVGGFVAGYYWRTLTEERSKRKEQRTQTKEA